MRWHVRHHVRWSPNTEVPWTGQITCQNTCGVNMYRFQIPNQMICQRTFWMRTMVNHIWPIRNQPACLSPSVRCSILQVLKQLSTAIDPEKDSGGACCKCFAVLFSGVPVGCWVLLRFCCGLVCCIVAWFSCLALSGLILPMSDRCLTPPLMLLQGQGGRPNPS